VFIYYLTVLFEYLDWVHIISYWVLASKLWPLWLYCVAFVTAFVLVRGQYAVLRGSLLRLAVLAFCLVLLPICGLS
jgi:hypothetical protein